MAFPELLGSPYANVRARALATRLWTGADLKILVESESVAKAASLVSREGDGSPSPAAVEAGLNREVIAFGLTLRKSLSRAARPLLDAVLARSWVENLRTLCRTFHGAESPPPQPLPTLPGLPAIPEFPRVRSVPELAEALPPGSYRKLLRRFRSAQEAATAVLDDHLLALYWQEVAATVRTLPAGWRGPARDILSGRADIDLFRVLWRLRYEEGDLRRSPDRVPPLGLGALLQRRFLSLDVLHRQVRRRLPGFLELDPGDAEAANRLEVRLLTRYRHRLRRACQAPPFGVAPVLAALFLKELEARDIKAILGAKRYRLGPEEVANLVCAETR